MSGEEALTKAGLWGLRSNLSREMSQAGEGEKAGDQEHLGSGDQHE